MKADFYPSSAHPYFAWAMENRRGLEIDGQTRWFAPPEYVILWKLAFYREGGGDKHLRDIRSMLLVQGAAIDRLMLGKAAVELRLEPEWITVTGGD